VAAVHASLPAPKRARKKRRFRPEPQQSGPLLPRNEEFSFGEYQRTKSELSTIIRRMASALCRVSFVDSDGVDHSARVRAESLYEAVALAVAEFHHDPLISKPGPMTEFTVAIDRPPVEHRIRLNQVSKWAETTTREGPAGITKRQRILTLLGRE